jgi:NAD(P)H-dependent nitrite reductase small subunit
MSALSMQGPRWVRVCRLDDILPESGVAALAGATQVAVFRVGDAVHALGNFDPASRANVLSRGIVGDVGGELVVASPLYKQHYSLITGRCLEDPALAVPVHLVRIMGGEIWVRAEGSAARPAPPRRRLAVVGGGMAALRTLEELLERSPAAYDVTVFDAEEHVGYNRVQLSPLLGGQIDVKDIFTHPQAWCSRHGITVHRADPVESIDRVHRTVRSRCGVTAAYDRLLLATGSVPVRLPLSGADLPGVMTFRKLADVETMTAASRPDTRAVVIGGGLLGIEAACGLLARGMAVTLVHRTAHLMERQLDAPAAELLAQELIRRGLTLLLPAEATAFLGEDRVTGVSLGDGTRLAADLVVQAVGVRPNTQLAREAGLPCGRGILVDDTLMTFDPAIYAVGECVEHRGTTFGRVAPLWDQARICAAQLAASSTRGYRSRPFPAQLKVAGIEVFSAGDFEDRPGRESLVMRDPARGIYRRLVIEQGRMRGAVLVGDTRAGGWYTELIREARDVSGLREQLMFGEPAGATPGAVPA